MLHNNDVFSLMLFTKKKIDKWEWQSFTQEAQNYPLQPKFSSANNVIHEHHIIVYTHPKIMDYQYELTFYSAG